jgi:uncharacterized protein (TIGR03435 family)
MNIQARYQPDASPPRSPSRGALLQSLLRERFGLVAHIEKRNMPVYLLKMTRRIHRWWDDHGRFGKGVANSNGANRH